MLPQYWGKGIVSEVLPRVIEYLFETKNLHRIEALLEAGNDSSCQVLRKVGFKLEGTLRDYEIKNGRFISLLLYSLLSTLR